MQAPAPPYPGSRSVVDSDRGSLLVDPCCTVEAQLETGTRRLPATLTSELYAPNDCLCGPLYLLLRMYIKLVICT